MPQIGQLTPNPNNDDFGNHLASRRLAAGPSRRYLKRLTDIARRMIANYKRRTELHRHRLA